MLTPSQRRSWARHGARTIEAEIDAAKQLRFEEEKALHDAMKAAAKEREANRRRYTRDDLEGATHIRDSFGWWRIQKLNAKTVTVDGMFGPDRVPFDKIRDHRTITEEPHAATDAAQKPEPAP